MVSGEIHQSQDGIATSNCWFYYKVRKLRASFHSESQKMWADPSSSVEVTTDVSCLPSDPVAKEPIPKDD